MTSYQVRTEELAWREVDGEIVVLDLSSSRYLALNGAAALLWPGLVAGTTEAALAQELVDTFAISHDRAADDVAAFLAECHRLRLTV